ncbi:MAG: hypothetical protein K2I44_06725, partial [Muribaculaceae bacterium]|nr:hypothetical protein [Muribaculaceae bacterium]
MKISFNLNYHTQWGEALYICGDVPQLGGGDPTKAAEMKLTSPGQWMAELEFTGNPGDFNYFFIVKAENKEWRFEWGKPHQFIGGDNIDHVHVFDSWQDMPHDKPYYSSAFVDGILMRRFRDQPLPSLPDMLQLRVTAPMVEPDEVLAIAGEGDFLGNWLPEKALPLNDANYPEWSINLPMSCINAPFEYKFIILKKETREVVAWETVDNRICGFVTHLPGSQIVGDGLKVANPRNNRKG